MKRFIKWARYLLLPIAILFIIGLLQWENITYFVARKVIQHYASQEKLIVEIEAIGGRPFSETTVEGISIRPSAEQPQAYHFKVQSITCTYHLWDMREGADFFLQGLSCSAQSPELVKDLSVSMPQDEAETDREALLLPAELPRLDVHSGVVILTNTRWNVEIEGINGLLQTLDASHELQLQAGSFRFVEDGEVRIANGFTSQLRYTDEKLIVDSLEIADQNILATGSVDLAQIQQERAGFTVELAFTENKLNIEGSFSDRLLLANVRTDNFDIGELQRRLGGSGWDVSGNITAEADLAVNLEQPVDSRGSFVLAVDNGQVDGVEFEAVSIEGNFDHESLTVFHAEARTLDNHILVKELLLPMNLLQSGDTLAIVGGSSARFQADIKDSAVLLKLIKVEGEALPTLVRLESLSLSGSLDNGVVYLDGAKAATAASSLVIDRAAIPVPAIQDGFSNLQIDLSARFESKNLDEFVGLFNDVDFKGEGAADLAISGTIKEPAVQLSLTGENLSAREVELGAVSARIEVELNQDKPGSFNAARFTVNEMTLSNAGGELLLTTPATGFWEQDIVSLAASLQIDETGIVNVELAGNPAKELNGEITARNLYSTGWFGGFIDDRYFFKGADLNADFKGLPGSPHLQLVGVIEEFGAPDVDFPLTGSFSLLYSPKGIEISEFTWNSYEKNTLTITGFLPYDPLAENPLLQGDIALEGYVNFPTLEDVAVFLEPLGISKGSVNLNMNVTGSWERPQGQILFRAKGLHPPDSLQQYVDSAMDISCDIVVENDTVFLKTATLDSASYTAQITGSWQHGLSLKGLMQGRQAELHGQVSADADVQLKDFNFLRNKISGLRRLEGDLRAKVHVAGPISDPAVTGSFSFIDGEIRHSYNFPLLSAINLQGKLDGKSIVISNMQLEMGGSPVTMDGSLSRDQETVEVSLQLTGRNVLLFRNNYMLIRGDVQLDVAGPLERLVIKGSTGLTAGYYARNIDFLGMIGSSAAPVSEGVNFLFSFQDPPLNQAVFDIRISAIEPFRIRNNLIRGSIRPDLSLRGTGKLPFLVGPIYIDPTRVVLPSGRLRIQSGLLRFLEANPDRPELNIVAQSRLLGYDINLITSGPLNNLAITLSSSPPLPNEDLMLLLLTGQPPRNDAAAGTQGTASANAMLYLGSDFLNRWLDDESGSSVETIYDRFDLDFGRDVTKSGDQTVESSFRISEEITGNGRAYYLTGEKDRYDAYNYGLRVVFRFE